MFGFLRKREKSSAFRLDADHKVRLWKKEEEIAQLKRLIALLDARLKKCEGEKENGIAS